MTRTFWTVLVLIATVSQAQNVKRALSVADLERLLRAGVTPQRAGTLVAERGISFDVKPGIKGQLRAAGADDALIAAVERAARQTRSRPAEQKPNELESARRSTELSSSSETGGEPDRKPRSTALVIRSNVSGDTAFIDGVEVGPSGSHPRPVTPGSHVVELRKEGVPSETKRVEVQEGETAVVRFALKVPARKTVASSAAVPAETVDAAALDGMVLVPGGPFFMGCDESIDSECSAKEKPGRMVDVAPFKIDKTEVTVAQFEGCVRAKACSSPEDDDEYCNWSKRADHPINCVSWKAAVAYCNWAGKRLPTDAEWEKAARGTDHRKYAWGNSGFDTGTKVANIEAQGAKRDRPGYDDGFVGTAPVGSFPAGASPSGALDMIGNVWEWTAEPLDGHPAVRGGAFSYGPQYARVSAHIWGTATSEYQHVGFRCAR